MSEQAKVEIRVDTYTRVCLTVIAVLLTVLALGLWCQAVPTVSPAGAAGPAGTADGGFGDTNARILAQLEVAKATNSKLDDIAKLLTSGQIKVQVVKDEKAAGGASGPQPKN